MGDQQSNQDHKLPLYMGTFMGMKGFFPNSIGSNGNFI